MHKIFSVLIPWSHNLVELLNAYLLLQISTPPSLSHQDPQIQLHQLQCYVSELQEDLVASQESIIQAERRRYNER